MNLLADKGVIATTRSANLEQYEQFTSYQSANYSLKPVPYVCLLNKDLQFTAF